MRRKDNGGQSLALKESFEASSGEYIVFLDADDFLLSAFVETHVFVHLSLRIPVGLTSAEMIQAVDSRVVLGTYVPLANMCGLDEVKVQVSCGRSTKTRLESGRCQTLAHPSKFKSISSNPGTPAIGYGRPPRAIAFARTR